MKGQPLISALVLNYRSPQEAVRCVRTLLAQTIADRMEILVIDNHSRDDSIGVLRNTFGHCPTVRILEMPKNLGFGAGYNAAVRSAAGPYVLFNNPSKELEPSGIEKLLARISSDSTIGIIAPQLLHSDGSRRLSVRSFPGILDVLARRSFLGRLLPGRMRRYLMLHIDPTQEHDVDWVVGGCFLMPRSLFLVLGGFDDRFFLFFEDTDLCRRCRLQGKRILYYPGVTGRDKQRRLSGEGFCSLLFFPLGRIHIASAMKYFWKWRKA